MLIDSHAHLDSERYAEDREALLRRAWQAGVGTVLTIGIGDQGAGMDRALAICREFNSRPESGAGLPRIYASAGIYPHDTPAIDDKVLGEVDRLLAEPEVIACGEIGLDYYHEGAPHDLQRKCLIGMLKIAASRKRPILIHCRPSDGAPRKGESGAWDDLFEILEAHWRHTGLGGIMHCFSGGLEEARHSLDLGFLISFAGNLTFPKSGPLRQVAAKIPLEHSLVETDAPWLAPVPNRGKRNEPAWVAETAKVLAEAHKIAVDELAAQTTKNFFGCFNLGPA